MAGKVIFLPIASFHYVSIYYDIVFHYMKRSEGK
jgi:hypothetical protein